MNRRVFKKNNKRSHKHTHMVLLMSRKTQQLLLFLLIFHECVRQIRNRTLPIHQNNEFQLIGLRAGAGRIAEIELLVNNKI